MESITIVDAIMGSGKTAWATQYMNMNKKSKKFIYVSPYLEEIQNNIISKCPSLIEPNANKGKGSKLRHFKDLLKEGKSIVTTHALFKLFDQEVITLLNNKGYTLILDEVANVIEAIDKVSKEDIQLMLESNLIEVKKDRKIIWNNEEYEGVFQSRYVNVKYHAEQGNLCLHNNSMLFWTFPSEVFKLFENTYVLTYLFDGQLQRYYYDLFGIKYTYSSVSKISNDYILTEYNQTKEDRDKFKNLINVYEGVLNENFVKGGKMKGNELSATWLKQACGESIQRLKMNLYTFFRSCGKSNENLWTTKKT